MHLAVLIRNPNFDKYVVYYYPQSLLFHRKCAITLCASTLKNYNTTTLQHYNTTTLQHSKMKIIILTTVALAVLGGVYLPPNLTESISAMASTRKWR